MAYTCPHCQKIVKDLNAHIRRQHKEQAAETPAVPVETTPPPPVPDEPATVPAPGKTKKLEFVNTPAQKKKPDEPAYHCVDCGHDGIVKGTPACPECGCQLDWSVV